MTPSSLRIINWSRFLQKKRGYDMFAFCLFIAGDSHEIDTISEVEYTLHPTFPNPIVSRYDRLTRFALESEAWGEFVVRARLFTVGGDEIRLSERLLLEADKWPRGAPWAELETINRSRLKLNHLAELIMECLLEGDWDWRKFSTIVRRTGAEPGNVSSTLRELGDARLAREAYFTSIDKEHLWGATERVGILPSIHDDL
jgi:hypothetical protein